MAISAFVRTIVSRTTLSKLPPLCAWQGSGRTMQCVPDALAVLKQHGTHNGCTKVMWAERAGGWRALPVGEVFGSKVRPRRRSRSRRSHRRGRRRRTGRAANSVFRRTRLGWRENASAPCSSLLNIGVSMAALMFVATPARVRPPPPGGPAYGGPQQVPLSTQAARILAALQRQAWL